MARIARAIASIYPHHITQRGNRRQLTFFCNDDYITYIGLMSEWCKKHKVDIWAYCLIPNHVHMIAVPEFVNKLERTLGRILRIQKPGRGRKEIRGIEYDVPRIPELN